LKKSNESYIVLLSRNESTVADLFFYIVAYIRVKFIIGGRRVGTWFYWLVGARSKCSKL